MKSKKAEEILSASSVTDSCGYEYLLTSCAKRAVEIAEQEMEERMRKKAIKAYCSDCCCTVVGTCGTGAENCIALRNFIQKLDEE